MAKGVSGARGFCGFAASRATTAGLNSARKRRTSKSRSRSLPFAYASAHCVKTATSIPACAFARAARCVAWSRAVLPRIVAFVASLFQRLAWCPLQAVATVAAASRTVATRATRSGPPLRS